MAEARAPLRILVQPQSEHRGRYNSEVDPTRNRSQRFIRAETNPYRLVYPTVEFTKQRPNKHLYIAITLVTVPSNQIPVTCIHPYPIDTPESGVIKQTERNTLYFQISDFEFENGRKSFRITRKKLPQYELKNYGQFCLLDSDEKDIQRLDDPTHTRKLIEVYQLQKSQLIFSFAELIPNYQYPVIYKATSIYSHITTAISTTNSNHNGGSLIKFSPKKGSCEGNDEILMVIPRIDRRKICKVIFGDFSTTDQAGIQAEFVDTKTISFKTPPCPIQLNENEKTLMPIVVVQGNEVLARAQFLYQYCENCSNSNVNSIIDSSDESNHYEENSMTTTTTTSGSMDGYLDGPDFFIYTGNDQNAGDNDGFFGQ